DAPDRLVAERLRQTAEAQLLLIDLEVAAPRVRALEDDCHSDVHVHASWRRAPGPPRQLIVGRCPLAVRPVLYRDLPNTSRIPSLFACTRSAGTPTVGA